MLSRTAGNDDVAFDLAPSTWQYLLPSPPPISALPTCSAMRVSATAASCQKCWSESSLSHRQIAVHSSSRYSAQATCTLHPALCTLHTDMPYQLPPLPLPFLAAVAQSMPHHCHSVTPRETKLLRELLLSHFLTLSLSLPLSQFLSVLVAFTFWKLYARFIKI